MASRTSCKEGAMDVTGTTILQEDARGVQRYTHQDIVGPFAEGGRSSKTAKRANVAPAKIVSRPDLLHLTKSIGRTEGKQKLNS